MYPLVSIVMPSLNQVAFMPAAVRSVLSQSYPQIELIVADGGSTDGTQEWLAQQQPLDARLRWFSGTDTGPADALNKALSKVRGTIVGWLNSDDLYTEGAVLRAVHALLEQPNRLMVYGHGAHINEYGDRLDIYPTLPSSTPVARFTDGCFICQPTVFFKRTMHRLLGPLDVNLKTAFDFDYWLRAFTAFPGRIGFVDAMQAQSRLHGDCITIRMRQTVILEGMQVLARHLGYAPKEWLLTYINELKNSAPNSVDAGDLNTHIWETLALARPCLQSDEFQDLQLRIESLLTPHLIFAP